MIDEADWSTHRPVQMGGGHQDKNCENTNRNGNRLHDYFEWVWGGDAKSRKWYRPASGMTGVYASSAKGMYVDDTTD